MAEIVKNDFNINTNYTENAETLLFDSSAQILEGKITSVVLDLDLKLISTSSGLVPASAVVNLYSGSGLGEQIIECGIVYVENQKIVFGELKKIYSGSKLANNGNTDFTIKIKASNNLSGTVKGTVTVSTTEDDEEQESETILGLNQSALSDWFKDQTSKKVKSGVSERNQYSIQEIFEPGKHKNLIWTNKGVNDGTIEDISVSLSVVFENKIMEQRTVDLDFNAAYGSETISDSMGMWILSPGQVRTISISKTYKTSDLVNDGFCMVTVYATNTDNVKCTVKGVVVLNSISNGIAETNDSVTDTSIQSILDMLDSDGCTVSGSSNDTALNIDSFLSNYTSEGYKDDMSLLTSDDWNTAAISNDMAMRILDLEQRLTALEERMNILNVGGTDIDWYDGGADGSDDAWGIDEWYRNNIDRITQTEQEGNVSYNLFTNEYAFDNVFFETGDYTRLPESIQNFNYYLLMSYRYSGELCIGKQFTLAILVKSENDEKEIELDTFSLTDEDIHTSDFRSTISAAELLDEGDCIIKGIAYFKGEMTEEEKEDIVENFEGRVSGNIDYQIQTKINNEKIKDSNELTVVIDTENFTGSQTIFSYNAQNRNENLQKVEITLTLGYNYDITESQLCVGQKMKIDFNTVAVHPGFMNQTTYWNVGEDTINSSEKSSKQKVYKATYTLNQFANNGNCSFSVDFVTPDITVEKLADFKEYFEGKITGMVKYTVIPN